MSLLSAGGERDFFHSAPVEGTQREVDRSGFGGSGNGGICPGNISAPPSPTTAPQGGFFAGELYLDSAKSSFKQLGFKKLSLLQLVPGLFSRFRSFFAPSPALSPTPIFSSSPFFCSYSCSRKWKEAKAKADSLSLGGNLSGDGQQVTRLNITFSPSLLLHIFSSRPQTGGVLVVGQGGAPTMYTYKQVLLLLLLLLFFMIRYLQDDPADHPENSAILEALGIQTT